MLKTTIPSEPLVEMSFDSLPMELKQHILAFVNTMSYEELPVKIRASHEEALLHSYSKWGRELAQKDVELSLTQAKNKNIFDASLVCKEWYDLIKDDAWKQEIKEKYLEKLNEGDLRDANHNALCNLGLCCLQTVVALIYFSSGTSCALTLLSILGLVVYFLTNSIPAAISVVVGLVFFPVAIGAVIYYREQKKAIDHAKARIGFFSNLQETSSYVSIDDSVMQDDEENRLSVPHENEKIPLLNQSSPLKTPMISQFTF